MTGGERGERLGKVKLENFIKYSHQGFLVSIYNNLKACLQKLYIWSKNKKTIKIKNPLKASSAIFL